MRTRFATGVTLIELLIGLVIVGVLLALGAPSFAAWLQSMQLRNAAESISNGLQLARANAIQRNKSVTFTMSGPDSSWSVTIDSPSAAEPALVQSRSAAEGSPNAVVATTDPAITFDGLGKTNLPAAATIQVTNPTGGACGTGNTNMRCLNLTVAVGGHIKMCDPQVLTAGDSRKC
ncbi:MAG TPA: GspH/FimT family pseudopilin [Burkholderiales bacterium]|nr:GspH/FimT family pseudopilin [Burkholderiales bacterium]